jgi:hypothetical protein
MMKERNMMKRTITVVLLLMAFLLCTSSLLAETGSPSDVVIHLGLTDSVRAYLKDGRTIKVSAFKVQPLSMSHNPGAVADTKTDTVLLHALPPGSWKIVAMIDMGALYMMEDDQQIEVPPGTRVEETISIPGIIATGRVMLHGRPLYGQMSLWPVDGKNKWGFSVAFDKAGRFAFYLPHPGKWDLQVLGREESVSALIPGFEIREIDALHEITIQLPDGAITGKVLDDAGNGVEGVRIVARPAQPDRPIGAGTVSGKDGVYALEGLSAGTWVVEAPASRLRFPTIAFEPITIALSSESRKEGVVLHVTAPKVVSAK